ncbi:TIGR02647 family protein [Alteromonas sp. KUL49]|uniref:TIGR02647 family protein n=1 Tax=Alteromonas sp. KUL49 TaxID=2480798 RepID=UPI00102F1000|nr:TIGR02647 family protein [Alteromonas sp. KUL49]TAP37925.1 TIGR02647 family protein [Alteromonas sp. KUL49]GEA12786.1 DNA-binding protein [Alteromonas sp. KUL49]
MNKFNQFMIDELDLLLTFPQESLMQGLKIHHDAHQSVVNAAERLFAKGMITQPDGGYLTDLGIDLANHARHIHIALKSGMGTH